MNILSIEVKATMAFTICNFFEKGMFLITTPIFTRILNEKIFGEISVFNSWRNILEIIITFSLFGGVINNAMLEFKEEKNKFISSIFVLITISALIFWILYKVIIRYNMISFKYSEELVDFMFLRIAFGSNLTIWSLKEKFEYKYKKIVLLTVIISILSPLFSYFLIKYGYLESSRAKIYGDNLILIIINFVIFIYFLFKEKETFNKKYWGYALKFNLPLIPHYLSYIVLSQVDRIMIANFIGVEEAGIYSIGYTAGAIVSILIAAINASFVPYTYKKMEEKKYIVIGSKAYKIVKILGVGTIIFILLGPEYIKLLAPASYYSAVSIVPSIIIGTYYIFIYTLFANIEFYHKKTSYIMYASVASAILNIILNYIFIPKLGYTAAGYTTMISYFFMIIVHCYCMKKIEKNIIYNLNKLFKVIFIITILGLSCVLIYPYLYVRIILILILIFGGIIKLRMYKL